MNCSATVLEPDIYGSGQGIKDENRDGDNDDKARLPTASAGEVHHISKSGEGSSPMMCKSIHLCMGTAELGRASDETPEVGRPVKSACRGCSFSCTDRVERLHASAR